MKIWTPDLWLATTSGHAKLSLNPKWRMACILIGASGDVVGVGVNSPSNLIGPPWTTHAEEAALEDSWQWGQPVTAYIARVNKQGKGRLARPCDNCAVQLKAAGVKTVHWTGVNGEHCQDEL